jgi:hypothetical protein
LSINSATLALKEGNSLKPVMMITALPPLLVNYNLEEPQYHGTI